MRVNLKILLLCGIATLLVVFGVVFMQRYSKDDTQDDTQVAKPPTLELWVPDHILSSLDGEKVVRAVNENDYPVKYLKMISQTYGIGKIGQGETMVFQYFDKSYDLYEWDHQWVVSKEDEDHFICEITVRYEPEGRENSVMNPDSYIVACVTE